MKNIKVIFTVIISIFCIVLGASHNAQAARDTLSINCGDAIAAQIDYAGEEDSYLYTAEAGEVISVQMSDEGSSFLPVLKLYDPSGTLVVTDTGDGLVSAELLGIELSTGGTYTIVASELNGDHTGPYGISLIRVDAPGCGQSIACGYSADHSIDNLGELDSYQYAAEAGEVISVQMSDEGSSFLPVLKLYDPSGTLVVTDTGDGLVSAELLGIELSTGGTYTIVASELNGDHTGPYGISLIRVDAPGCGQSIACGYSGSHSIDNLGELDSYQYTAEAGEVISVQMSDEGSSFLPVLKLYDPSGTLVVTDTGDGLVSAELLGIELSTGGTYTIVASELNGDYTEPYGISLIRVDAPGCGQSIACGYSADHSIDNLGELDSYQYAAEAGEVISVQMSDEGSSFLPVLKLYDPSGTLVVTDTGDGLVSAELLGIELSTGGTYTIVASELNGDHTGPYGISLIRVDAPGCGQSIACGYSADHSIDNLGELDSYQYAAEAGEVISVQMSDEGSSFLPVLKLYDPSGTLVVTDTGDGLVSAELLGIELSTGGTYTIVASELNGDHTGPYGISLIRVDAPGCGQSIACGYSADHSIDNLGELDSYQYAAEAGEVISVQMSDEGSSFLPVLKLYDPSGTLVVTDTGSGTLPAEILALELTAGGTYTIVASEARGDDIWSYTLCFVCSDYCFGTRGNINGSPCDDVDISDLTYLVNYFFGGGPPPLSMLEADVNGSGAVDISDLTYLVDWLFGGGPDPADCP